MDGWNFFIMQDDASRLAVFLISKPFTVESVRSLSAITGGGLHFSQSNSNGCFCFNLRIFIARPCYNSFCQRIYFSAQKLHHHLVCNGLKLIPKTQFSKERNKFSTRSSCFKTPVSCSLAQPETLKTVQNTIAKQLSIDASTVTPDTKFADLGADSLDTVEIMMALEEQFGVSVGEGGAENIATVQDAADLIEKVKATAA
ncbi:hypothetical protein V6Z11_A06G095200 [Gossypium hirsutum]